MLIYTVVFIALFLGCMAQSAVGFGSMLIAMPLLTFVLPLQVAAPVLALIGPPTTIYIFHLNRHGVDWREVGRIMAGALAGVPLGLWALESLNPAWIMRAVGAVLVAYAVYVAAIEPRLRPRANMRSGNIATSLAAGLCTGVLGGAFNTGGPPLILYGDWLRWPRARFKAILQAVFLANGTLIIIGHALAGNVHTGVLPYAAAATPGVIAGLYAGRHIDRLLSPAHFRYAVLGMVALLGLSLIAR
ncbi:MAG: sulfite exporter TauE/SafE family protein [Candidatus Hydrogenedentes bacterium]|nr:sulfite exporter TauE/SafE family protein [Candidatus Hydrogenedentota bacterium]